MYSDSSLHRLFSQNAKTFCGNVAIEYENVKLTYDTLDRKSNRFGKFLMDKLSIQNEDVVAILLPRSPELYITMLAVLKAGGVYVCIDPQHQRSRLGFILKDTQARALVTTPACIQHDLDAVPDGTPIIDLKSTTFQQELQSYNTSSILDRYVSSSNLCYIIYTSGSTGNPKGVEIEHRTVLNFIEGELEIYPISSQDRILQGFSPSFDASVEEIWLAFSTGATLVVASQEVMQSGPDLPDHLDRLKITVFSTVPALLRTIDYSSSTDLPLLKLLILGGEACGEELSVWSEGRMLVNSYGPTETTVVATASIVQRNKKITIGKPLKNYKVWILDINQNEVPHGQQGELCIGGRCLARGYRNLIEKTNQQFVVHPMHGKIYRTGDMVRFNDDGDLEYLGRIDDQVKIRGFRVEVGSIETHLYNLENIGIASVVVIANPKGQQLMIAHIKLEDKVKGLDSISVVKSLKMSLPEYMIPNGYVLHDELPKLASGKIDKKTLKSATYEIQPFKSSQENYIAPRHEIEKKICEVWEDKLGNQKVSVEDNFFDLGGQSVVGALIVSELRKEGINVSVRDLYLSPTVAGLSAVVRSRNSDTDKVTIHVPTTPLTGTPRYYLCTVMQAFWLLTISASMAIFGLYSILLFIQIYNHVYDVYGTQGLQALMLLALVVIMVSMPLYIMVAILLAYVVKKIFLWRVTPGIYALWSMYYLRWWIVKNTMSLVPSGAISGTPLMNVYARIMGATIGRGVYYGTQLPCDFDLLEIGSSVTIEQQVSFETHRVDKGALILGPITIADHCSIGARTTIALNSIIKENVRIEPLTLVTDNSVIEEDSYVSGSPATQQKQMSPYEGKPTEWSWSWWVPCAQIAFLSVLAFVFALPVTCVVMTIMSVPYLYNAFLQWNMGAIAIMVPIAAVFIQTLFYLTTALLKWAFVGKMEEGVFSINSWRFLELWIMERLIAFTLFTSKELFATLYTNVWLKTLGMEVGAQAEFSTAFNYVPDLTVLEEGCFVADHVCLGGPVFHGGTFSLSRTRTGYRTFLGNNCVVKQQSIVGDEVLVGVLSTTPEFAKNGTSWLGSPSFPLPSRQKSMNAHPYTRTFNPPWYLYVSRLIWEFFKLFSPSLIRLYAAYGLTTLIIKVTFEVFQEGTVLFWFSAAFWGWGISACILLLVILSKWILIGRFRPCEKPLWSSYVWRAELVASLEENVALSFGVSTLLGTPFIAWWYRALGAKIGSRVYLASIYLTEADLIEIGDKSCIATGTTIQAHLFEDRVMKMDKLVIGNECTICSNSIVLYGAKLEDRCTLMPLSLCMKSETLQGDAVYCGIPSQNVYTGFTEGSMMDAGFVPSKCTTPLLKDAYRNSKMNFP